MGSDCTDEFVRNGFCNGDSTTSSVWCEAKTPCYGKQRGDDCSDGRTLDGFCNGAATHSLLTLSSMWCEPKGPCHGRSKGADCSDEWTPDGFCNSHENGAGMPPSVWCERKGPCYGKSKGMDCSAPPQTPDGFCNAYGKNGEMWCEYKGPCYGRADGEVCSTAEVPDGVCRSNPKQPDMQGWCRSRLPPKLPCSDKKASKCGRVCNPFAYCRTAPDVNCRKLPHMCKAPGPKPCESYAHCFGWAQSRPLLLESQIP